MDTIFFSVTKLPSLCPFTINPSLPLVPVPSPTGFMSP